MSGYVAGRRCDVCGCESPWSPLCGACETAERYEDTLEAARATAHAAGYAEAVAKFEPVLREAIRALSNIPIVVGSGGDNVDYSCKGCGAVGSNECVVACWVPAVERAVDNAERALVNVGAAKKGGG